MREIANIYFNKSVFNLYGKLERFQGEWEKLSQTNPAYLSEKKTKSLISSVTSSVRVNGGVLEHEDVEPFLAQDYYLRNTSPKELQEAYAYYRTLKYVNSRYSSLAVSEETLKKLHRMLTEHFPNDIVPKDLRGEFKKESNDIVTKNRNTGEKIVLIKASEPGEETENAISALINEYHELVDAGDTAYLVIVAAFIINFLSILPFRSSNGELSRILTSFLLLKGGYKWVQFYPHEKGIELLKDTYFTSIRQTHGTLYNNEPNYLPWLEFFLKTLYANIELPDLVEEDKRLIARMNRNERKVYALIQSFKLCSTSFIRDRVGMSKDGLKTLLTRMVLAGYLKRSGKGKGTKYSINP